MISRFFNFFDMSTLEGDLLLVEEEDLLLVEEEVLFLVEEHHLLLLLEEEDLLLLQEEDLLLLQEEDLLRLRNRFLWVPGPLRTLRAFGGGAPNLRRSRIRSEATQKHDFMLKSASENMF